MGTSHSMALGAAPGSAPDGSRSTTGSMPAELQIDPRKEFFVLIITRLAALLLTAAGGDVDSATTDAYGRSIGTINLPPDATTGDTRWDGVCWRTPVIFPCPDHGPHVSLVIEKCEGWSAAVVRAADRTMESPRTIQTAARW